MIYDFGCGHPTDLPEKIILALTNAAAMLAVAAGFSALGSSLRRHATFQAADIFCGWGLVAAFMTLVGVAVPHSFAWTGGISAAFMLAAILRAIKGGYFKSPFWLWALVCGLPMLAAIDLSGIYGWDAYAHWVPNAITIFHNDSFPDLTTPPVHSGHAGYPYAMAFVVYLASHLAGGFLVQGAAMFNFILLLAFAEMLTHLPDDTPHSPRQLFSLIGIALAVLVLANPSFHAGLTLTNYNDTPTMVLTAALALSLWKLAEQMRHQKPAPDFIAQIALVATAFILVKQVNIILLFLLAFSFLVISARNGKWRQAVLTAPILIAPAIFLRLMWGHYVTAEIHGEGFGILPFSEWHFDLALPLLQAMTAEMGPKIGFFALVLIILGYAAAAWRQPPSPQRNFTLLAAIMCAGYPVVLFMTYLGSTFSEGEIRTAASFYRYVTHVGLIEMAFLWILLQPRCQKIWGDFHTPVAKSTWLVALSLALPVVFIADTRLFLRPTGEAGCKSRELSRSIVKKLPDHARIAVIEPKETGFVGLTLNLQLALNEIETGHSFDKTRDVSAIESTTPEDIQQRFLSGNEANALLVQSDEFSLPAGFDTAQKQQTPYLLYLWQDNHWARTAY